jgi:NAD(P)H dehydrogenase (quinone)
MVMLKASNTDTFAGVFTRLRRTLLGCLLLLPLALSTQAADNDKYIISGASGKLGELTVKELLKRGVPAKNLILVSRTPDKLVEYAKQGASVRFGDLTKPESLPAAYAGGTRMLLISIGLGGTTPRPELHKRGFDAAVKAGVKYIAYTSFIGADTGTSGLALDHRQSEEALKASGAKWTMLRNGLYADRVVQQAVEMVKTGRAVVSPNDPKSASVTREDCAAAAAGALLNPKFENKAFDITGPALFNTADIAATASAITGKKIEVVTQADDAGNANQPGPNGPPPSAGPGNPSAGGPSAGALGAGPPPAGGMGGGMMVPATVTNAVQELSGRPATGLRTLLEADKTELMAAAK